MKPSVKVALVQPERVVSRLGLGTYGAAQKFHTQNCLRRIAKYMPYRSGATIKLTIIQSGTDIVTDAPYAKYLYYGKAMEGKAPKTVTNRNLHYTTTKNAQAGPYWDRHLVAAEGKILKSELQAFVNRGAT